MIYTNLNNSGEVEAVYAAKRAIITGAPPLSYPSKGYDLEDFLISGNTVQDGTPTPSNPVGVIGCGEQTENLYNRDSDENLLGYINANGSTIITQQYGNVVQITHKIPVVSGKTYWICNAISSGSGNYAAFYDANESPISVFSVVANRDYIKTAPQGAAYFRTTNIFRNVENKLMFVESEEFPTSYIPYGYKIPITCGGETQNIYLGKVQTTRNIKKLVLDGTENWTLSDNNYFSDIIDNTAKQNIVCRCTHLISDGGIYVDSGTSRLKVYSSAVSSVAQNVDEWKAFLTNQYAAGTPVTVWYVLAEPETSIVDEPLHKIGDYADTISLSQSGITVSTTAGTNTITTETTVLPSSIFVTTPEKEVAEVYAGINYQNPVYYKSRTLTGASPLTFKGLGQPLSGYQIYGNMTQNGTPTPDDPIFPQECGEKTENLYDKLDAGITYKAFLNFGGGISLYQSYGNALKVSGYIPVVSGGEYKLIKAIVPNATSTYCAFYDANKKFINSVYLLNNTTQTLTAPSNAHFFRTTVKHINVKDECMFVQSDVTPQSYIPYGYKIPITCGGVTQNIYLDEPLRKIGDYADEVKSDGTAVRKIKKIVLDGTENWQPLWGVLYCILPIEANTTSKATTVMCDRYNAKGNLLQAQGYPSHYGDCSITFRDYQSSLLIRDDRYGTDAAAYKSYLADQYAAGTPVTIWYVLAEDQVEAVTLPQIPTISGQNTLSFGTALQPSSVSVTGHIKPTG